MAKEFTQPTDRKVMLDRRREEKMAESAHAYVRGNTAQFYEWLIRDGGKAKIPSGPPIWICGDCHIGNLGPVANLTGEIEIQIRDLDQTVIGNPALDLIRLGLSLAMAARGSDLPGVTTAKMIEALIDAYTRTLAGRSQKVKSKQIVPIQRVMHAALRRRWRHLAEERIEDVTPQIPLGRKFWPLTREEKKGLRALFKGEKERKLIAILMAKRKAKKIKLIDAAYWMKGCSSLGRVRYAALVRANGKYRILDIKEATKAAASAAKSSDMPADYAERVVAGARSLSPFLGDRMIATTLEKRSVVVRELRPQDIKFDLSTLTQEEAVLTARLFSEVVGKAHARQMTRAERKAWAKELRTDHTTSLDAPSWLWNAVLALVSEHEASYLSHCRKFASA